MRMMVVDLRLTSNPAGAAPAQERGDEPPLSAGPGGPRESRSTLAFSAAPWGPMLFRRFPPAFGSTLHVTPCWPPLVESFINRDPPSTPAPRCRRWSKSDQGAELVVQSDGDELAHRVPVRKYHDHPEHRRALGFPPLKRRSELEPSVIGLADDGEKRGTGM